MNLSTLEKIKGNRQTRKRRGRGPGSGLGKTAGKGHKGQKARSGGKIPAWFEGGQMPLQRRVPKFGFTNIFRTEYQVVNLCDLARFGDVMEFDPDFMRKNKLVRKKKSLIKVLGDGELSKKLTIKAHAFSKSAREKIEKAGGIAEVIS